MAWLIPYGKLSAILQRPPCVNRQAVPVSLMKGLTSPWQFTQRRSWVRKLAIGANASIDLLVCVSSWRTAKSSNCGLLFWAGKAHFWADSDIGHFALIDPHIATSCATDSLVQLLPKTAGDREHSVLAAVTGVSVRYTHSVTRRRCLTRSNPNGLSGQFSSLFRDLSACREKSPD
jgi:hypothetical protein